VIIEQAEVKKTPRILAQKKILREIIQRDLQQAAVIKIIAANLIANVCRAAH